MGGTLCPARSSNSDTAISRTKPWSIEPNLKELKCVTFFLRKSVVAPHRKPYDGIPLNTSLIKFSLILLTARPNHIMRG